MGAGHAMVDGGVEEAEEEGFAADDGLVVAFDVGDDLFFRAAGGEFVVEVFDVPVFVFDFGGETCPDIGDAHGEAEVEAGLTRPGMPLTSSAMVMAEGLREWMSSLARAR